MSQSKITEDATHAGGACNGGGFWARWCVRDVGWMATVFVATCVFIAHKYHWLDPIDGSAFILGNGVLHAVGADTAAMKPDRDSVVVVRIDEQTFQTRYRERSPLDRCVLSSQLSAIYKAQPETLVIDLDLSPVEGEQECQEKLHATLKNGATKTRTVVMDSFDSFDPDVTASRTEWQREQEDAGIRFGDAALPVNYGMARNYYSDSRTLYAAARRSEPLPPTTAESDPPSREHRPINPSAYRAKLQLVLTSWTYTPANGTARDNDDDLTDTLRALWSASTDQKIVFFGAGYGHEDTFLTPVGMLYGVEVHAAAFWTSGQDRWDMRMLHVSELLIDIVIALMFSIVIAWCWTRYFAWRCDEHSAYGQAAPIWVAVMLAVLLLGILVWSVASFLVLNRVGLWLSPIPLAVGTLIDSCMVGSVEAAVRRMHGIQSGPAAMTQSPRLITKLLSACRMAIWLVVVAWALRLALFH